MSGLNRLASILLVIGGINWALVGLFKFDLVAAITGNRFGEKNKLSSTIYDLVGLSAIYKIVAAKQQRSMSQAA
jgi:uncharacterized membrane protein YuzA (DUF378 family)